MYTSEENPALFTVLAGLIVLVMTGVGLSLLADRKFQFSNAEQDAEQQMEAEGAIVANLKSTVESRLDFLNLNESNKTLSGEVLRLRSKNVKAKREISELTARRADLEFTILAVEDSFKQSKSNYRRNVWPSAVGEKLGELRLNNGRIYQEVAIKEVTDVGLQIVHADGIARIQPPELSSELQARFQWDSNDRKSRLREELAASNQFEKEINVQVVPAGQLLVTNAPTVPVANIPPPNEQLAKLQNNVSAWQTNVDILERNASDAESRTASGQTSVPGSLETWKVRATRFKNDLVRARTELNISRSKLAEVAPTDPLLLPTGSPQ